MSRIFDEYKEEINESAVKYGIMYTYRSLSDMFDSYEMSPRDEEVVYTILKLGALKEIRAEIDEEYNELRDRYLQFESKGLIDV